MEDVGYEYLLQPKSFARKAKPIDSPAPATNPTTAPLAPNGT